MAAPAYKKELQALKAIASVYQEMMQQADTGNKDTSCEAIVFSRPGNAIACVTIELLGRSSSETP